MKERERERERERKVRTLAGMSLNRIVYGALKADATESSTHPRRWVGDDVVSRSSTVGWEETSFEGLTARGERRRTIFFFVSLLFFFSFITSFGMHVWLCVCVDLCVNLYYDSISMKSMRDTRNTTLSAKIMTPANTRGPCLSSKKATSRRRIIVNRQ